MKRRNIFLICLLLIFVLPGCVKTEDLEKRRAEEAALLEEANKTQEQTDTSTETANQGSATGSTTPTEESANEPAATQTDNTDTDESSNDVDSDTSSDVDQLKEQLLVSEEKIKDLEAKLVQANEQTVMSGPTLGNSLLAEATNIMAALSANDMSTLSLYVPTLGGLRLSPYQYVNISGDIVLTQNDVLNLFTLPTVYTWGNYDGSGDPINLTATNYYSEFIYDYNYLVAPQIGQNTILSSGNMINNITTVYPTASFVEFYFPGFAPQYGGMDWSSLTLVMENQGGYWKLIGIVHGQWTI